MCMIEGGPAASAVNLADRLKGVDVRVQDYQNGHQIASGPWENVCLNMISDTLKGNSLRPTTLRAIDLLLFIIHRD